MLWTVSHSLTWEQDWTSNLILFAEKTDSFPPWLKMQNVMFLFTFGFVGPCLAYRCHVPNCILKIMQISSVAGGSLFQQGFLRGLLTAER